ncbi:hypothetical protein [Mesorhizobium sp. M0030]|uniref:hypothetical protein n=1 Tax=Mesorhizobium sp. M0030 TaxID=2956851 RepID=UPI00333BABDE
MIYETVVAPTERVSNSLELKRALLTFDRVVLFDPDDREFFPPQSFFVAMGAPPFVGMNTGPVKPLGKAPGYDDAFQKLLDEFSVAGRQGLVDVVSSYDRSSSDLFTIGAVQMGGYPLNPRFLLWAFRNIARDEEVVSTALEGDEWLFSLPDETVQELAIQSAADGGINDDPAIAPIQRPLNRENLREEFSRIGRARIASVMKTIGFCASRNMVPFLGQASTGNIANRIASRANSVMDKVTEFDPFWATRSQVMRIGHSEYIDEAVLATMPVEEVLKLRTRAWGHQAAARDEMLQSIAAISADIGDTAEFQEKAQASISAYRKEAEELEQERANLRFQIKCEVAKAVALSGSGGGAEITGLLSQLQSGIGAAATLFAGCLYAIDKIKDYGPVSQQLKAAENEFRDKAGFGLHNFYEGIKQASRA